MPANRSKLSLPPPGTPQGCGEATPERSLGLRPQEHPGTPMLGPPRGRHSTAAQARGLVASFRRGPAENTKPIASAPTSTAVSTSCLVFGPHLDEEGVTGVAHHPSRCVGGTDGT